jgi:DHA2 family multidrug resistance protein-like MFS transporter
VTSIDHVRAGRREWLGLAALALPCLLMSMDLTVLYLAVPDLSEDLQPSSTQLLWITDVYGFMLAGCLITMGTLGDRVGRRRLLLIGASAFAAASVLAAFSTSAEMLIATRAMMGVAAATLMPSTLSLIRNMFHDEQQRTRAMGIWIMSFSVGGAIGPLVGGVLLEHFWWGSVLLLPVPVMLLLLAVGPRLLPEFRAQSPGRFDLRGAALSIAAVLLVVYGIKRLAEGGVDAVPLLAIVAGLGLGVVFVLCERKAEDGLVDLELFRVPSFSASLAVNLVSLFVMFGSFWFVAQYLQLVLGMEPLEAGLWTVPQSLAFVLGSLLTPYAVRRYRPGHVVAAGAALAACAFVILTRVDGDDGLAALVAGSFVLGLGLAPMLALATDLVLTAAPPERAGSASAVSETSAELGGALGIAVLGSIGTAVYRTQVDDALLPEVPPDAASAARDTLGAAVGAAEELPAALSAPLLDVTRDAFATGLQVTAAISAALMLACAALAWAVLGRRSAP